MSRRWRSLAPEVLVLGINYLTLSWFCPSCHTWFLLSWFSLSCHIWFLRSWFSLFLWLQIRFCDLPLWIPEPRATNLNLLAWIYIVVVASRRFFLVQWSAISVTTAKPWATRTIKEWWRVIRHQAIHHPTHILLQGIKAPLHLVILILHHLHLVTNLLLIKHNAVIMDLLKDINRVTRDISILDIHLSSTLHLNSTLHFLHPILNAVTPAFWKDAWQLFAAAVCLRSAARDMV